MLHERRCACMSGSCNTTKGTMWPLTVVLAVGSQLRMATRTSAV